MIVSTLLLALAAAMPAVFASPVPEPLPAPKGEPKNATLKADFSIAAAPTFYSGPWWNFPAMNTWLTFEDMFNRNKPSMLSTGNTGEDVGRIWNAIKECAKKGVDERVILGIIMQESHGNVGVITTKSPDGIDTAGLMQCSGCPGFPGRHGLSQAQITSMVCGGTDHYKANLRNWGDKWAAESIYPALREYNSGSVNPDNLSDARGATASYVSDISQRLNGRFID